jgi:prevent-host-death family protein
MDVTSMSVSELRASLGRRIDAAWYGSEPTLVTIHGESRAVLISYEEWARLCALRGVVREQWERNSRDGCMEALPPLAKVAKALGDDGFETWAEGLETD